MDGGEVEDALSRILSDLESLPPDDPLPDSSLRDLLSLLASPSSPALCSSPFGEDDAFPLWPRLSSSGLSLSTLLRPLSAAMDLAFPRSSLLASRVYLSLLLTHSAPVLSIFSPLAFLSLLGSLRRAIKPLPSPPQADRRRKRKLGRLVPPDDQMEDQEHDAAANEDQILIVLGLLDSALSRIRLDSSPDGFKSLVDTVAAVLSSSFVDHHRFSSVCFQIFYSLICRPEHGDHTTVTAEVLKSLAMLILSSPPKSPLRVGTLGFVIRKIVPLSKEHVEIRKALVYFPRYLASKAPERADPRAAAVDAMLEVVRVFQKEDQVGFAEYVVKMTQGKSQLRLLSVDLILGLLTSLPDPLGVDETVEPAKCWGMKSLKALLQRCSDSMGGIRARALTNIAQVIEFLLKSARSSARLQQGIEFGNAEFNELLRKRCLDEKAAVRKAALLLITKSTALIGGQIDEVVLRTIGSACLDPLVSIRKAAVSALSEVYRQFPDERVITEWLHSVPCLIVDNETSIQEDSENFFLELILDQISIASDVSISDSAKDLESVIPDRVLVLLKGLCNMEVLPSVGKICNSLGKKKKLKASVVTSLQNIISISESLWLRKDLPIERWIAPVGAWKLLSEVSLFTPKAVDWRFLHHHWNLLDKAMTLGKDRELDRTEPNSVTWVGDRVSLLQTISNVSLMLTPVAASELAADLLRRIDEFNMHLCEVDAHAKALRTLCKLKAVSPEEGNDLIAKWVHQLLSGALGIVESYMSRVSETVNTDCFVTPSGTREGNNEEASCKLLPQAITAIFTIGSLALIYPSAELHHIAALLHTIITSGKPGAKATKLKGLSISMKEIAPSLYIQAWVTMGKICLVDDKLAKRYIPLFVQELESSKCAALRNNILVVMVDFCVRYTALVDCYIPKITTMLHDPCEVVRRQTFILLSRLLQRDYVKWRGVLFLNFLLSLVDDSEKIRNLAEYLFGNILKGQL
ncbi:hypothetical protein AXF42_Ash013723 [Apostasia shenzhenica]|uniref:Condensin complex subunit 1 C-terminal domain-containing protein n=1 Tax=Apostasia shenzhenica TaxID=1088818 RepID=A0A2I0A4P0_9ASPA|nr:hypothetical protein AXF42_Ash013723 [Apostasia shenzhenica]